MADKSKPESPATAFPPDVAFAIAYLGAKKELERLIEEEKAIALKKAQLRDTMKALAPLVAPELSPDMTKISLADAIRIVIRSAGRPINALEIRGRLKDLGYDVDQHENPMASIHTALRRMEENDEITPREWDGSPKKKAFEPGPELKPLPETTPYLEALGGMSVPENCGDKTSSEKK
jgi:hypothetical protein